LLLALGVRLLVPQIASLTGSLSVLRSTAWWLFALALLVRLGGQLSTGLVLRSIAGMSGRTIALPTCALLTAATSAVGLVAGGLVGVGAASYHWLRDHDVDRANAVLAASLPTWLNNASIALIAVVGLMTMLARGKLTALEFAGYALGLALVVAVFGTVPWALRHRTATARAAHWCRSRWAALRRALLATWDALRAGPWRAALLGALLASALDMLALYLLFRSAHYVIDGWALATGYGLPLLASKVVAVPGGVGVVEAAMGALYRELGVPADISAVVVMAYRLLSFWLPTLIGFVALPFLNRGRARRAPTPSA
jgi:hypothetical protein